MEVGAERRKAVLCRRVLGRQHGQRIFRADLPMRIRQRSAKDQAVRGGDRRMERCEGGIASHGHWESGIVNRNKRTRSMPSIQRPEPSAQPFNGERRVANPDDRARSRMIEANPARVHRASSTWIVSQSGLPVQPFESQIPDMKPSPFVRALVATFILASCQWLLLPLPANAQAS